MRIKYIHSLFFLIVILCAFISCSSVTSKPIHDKDGIMYGMIYDSDNIAVNGVQVYVDDKRIGESDIQGRFILSSAKGGEHRIALNKEGYEAILQSFNFDPMNVLYFKMINTPQLISLAESALDVSSYEVALSYLDRAVMLGNNRSDILFLQAIVFYHKGEYDSAGAKILEIEKQGYDDESVAALKEKIRIEVEKNGSQ